MSHDLPVLPGDPHDDRLVAHTHPVGRHNPTPAPRYHLVVVGGGPAGLVAAFGAAGLGAKVAIVERGLLGGDCLVTGCVPSKALLASAHAVGVARGAGALGVGAGPVEVDFAAVMARMRGLRADIAPHDSVARLEAAGIDVFLGDARFTGRDRLEVDGAVLRYARALIATGARPVLPPIPGLAEASPLTSHSVFSLTERPASVVVIGGGPVGVELAQAFARLGSRVTLLASSPTLLPKDDPEASAVVADALRRDGVTLYLRATVTRVLRDDGVEVRATSPDGPIVARAERVLVAAGRAPNVEGLGLQAAGVRTGERGVIVDDHLRTTNPRVFAAGDVIGGAAFTHAADAMARVVVQNALFLPTKRVSGLVIPWVTYTDPELAHVGPSFATIATMPNLTTYTVPLSGLDRAITDGDTHGFARVHVDHRGRIVAATAVGAGAGESIAEVTLAMTQGLTLGQIGATIHAYPTRSEAWKRLADMHNRTRLTPTVAAWIRRWIRLWLGAA